MPLHAPALQSRLKLKLPDPSTKNGRRSLKYVSNADRFTTAGSASTCPKSGFTVVVSVRAGVNAYFMSMPSAPSGAERFTSGLPAVGCFVRLASMDGTISSFLGDADIDRPPSSPHDDTQPGALRGSSGHVDGAFSRPIWRGTAKPT